MNNINNVLIEGHLCQDPSSKEVIPGKTVCKFTIAVNRSFFVKEQKNSYVSETSFFPVNVWGELGELCQKYMKKGRGIRIVGHLKQERWQDSKTNELKQIAIIVAEHVEFMPEHRKPEEPVLDKESKDVLKANNKTPQAETEPAVNPDEEEEDSDNIENKMDYDVQNDPAMSPKPEEPESSDEIQDAQENDSQIDN